MMRSLVREVVQAALLAASIFLLVQTFIPAFRVEQRSMEPTLREGQYLLVNRAAYLNLGAILARRASAAEPELDSVPLFGSPARGDLVVLRHPDRPGQHLIKRVVGLPGETVEVRGRRLSIGGVPLDEPYLVTPPSYELPPQVIPAGRFFVLGDNRNNSHDSHVFGPVPREMIVGKAIPLPHFSLPHPLDDLPTPFRAI